eukprot:TRINITY_DN27325_c0_g1_i1.p1 TRINITY_DN27325_c0_g1~~TRINITY_DN27325_c0_g1_i1.p1  ORF type:complete len:231 (+),score=29.81 TRINITY_DN27325_c0_g1_i1:120-812(+)
MVSFSCDNCGEVVKKPKVQGHFAGCRPRSMSCIDCSKTFDSYSISSHSTCISEAEKYQGALYRGKKQGGQQNGGKPANGAAAPKNAPANAAAAPKTPTAAAKTEAAPSAAAPKPVEAPAPAEAAPEKKKKRKADTEATEASTPKKQSEAVAAAEPEVTSSSFAFESTVAVEKRVKRMLKKANGSLPLGSLVESLVQSLLPSLTEEVTNFARARIEQSEKYKLDEDQVRAK